MQQAKIHKDGRAWEQQQEATKVAPVATLLRGYVVQANRECILHPERFTPEYRQWVGERIGRYV